jgi:hypothetical protein
MTAPLRIAASLMSFKAFAKSNMVLNAPRPAITSATILTWVSAMPVKDHPKWNEWSDAYDNLVAAAEELKKLENRMPTDSLYQNAKERHSAALLRYNQVSNQID